MNTTASNPGDDAPKKNEDRVIRQMPSISALQELVKGLPVESKALVTEVVGEVRQILTKVAEASAVIFVSDIAKNIKTLKVRPDDEVLKEFIELAAQDELRESGVDIKAAIIHRTLGSVSRYYLPYGTDGEEARTARREWAIALEKLHKHFSGEPIEEDDIALPGNAAA
ncbi:hypothetical protein [Luteolibacter soli]|uniref:Uncharacterized protein n=1 Tax=Luteolibacter soli TaxID=3135280 RepID=A0ABU9B3C5_9BACT